jgi:hypothetical protein
LSPKIKDLPWSDPGKTADLYGRAAVYVDQILKGVKPSDFPVQQGNEVRIYR